MFLHPMGSVKENCGRRRINSDNPRGCTPKICRSRIKSDSGRAVLNDLTNNYQLQQNVLQVRPKICGCNIESALHNRKCREETSLKLNNGLLNNKNTSASQNKNSKGPINKTYFINKPSLQVKKITSGQQNIKLNTGKSKISTTKGTAESKSGTLRPSINIINRTPQLRIKPKSSPQPIPSTSKYIPQTSILNKATFQIYKPAKPTKITTPSTSQNNRVKSSNNPVLLTPKNKIKLEISPLAPKAVRKFISRNPENSTCYETGNKQDFLKTINGPKNLKTISPIQNISTKKSTLKQVTYKANKIKMCSPISQNKTTVNRKSIKHPLMSKRTTETLQINSDKINTNSTAEIPPEDRNIQLDLITNNKNISEEFKEIPVSKTEKNNTQYLLLNEKSIEPQKNEISETTRQIALNPQPEVPSGTRRETIFLSEPPECLENPMQNIKDLQHKEERKSETICDNTISISEIDELNITLAATQFLRKAGVSDINVNNTENNLLQKLKTKITTPSVEIPRLSLETSPKKNQDDDSVPIADEKRVTFACSDDVIAVESQFTYPSIQENYCKNNLELKGNKLQKKNKLVKKTLHYDKSIQYSANDFSPEYINDIITLSMVDEYKVVLKRGFYLKYNPCLENRTRTLNWLIHMQDHLDITSEMYSSIVSLFDDVLSKIAIPDNMYQLVVVTLAWLMNKFSTTNFSHASKIVKLCSNPYTPKQLLDMEWKILSIVQFNFGMPNPFLFMNYYLHKLNIQTDHELTFATYYILESFTLSSLYSTYKPSEIAAAALYLCTTSLYPTKNIYQRIEYIRGYYSPCKLLDLIESMLQHMKTITLNNYIQVIFSKYNTSETKFISKICNEFMS